jgi:hypothetical protein
MNSKLGDESRLGKSALQRLAVDVRPDLADEDRVQSRLADELVIPGERQRHVMGMPARQNIAEADGDDEVARAGSLGTFALVTEEIAIVVEIPAVIGVAQAHRREADIQLVD